MKLKSVNFSASNAKCNVKFASVNENSLHAALDNNDCLFTFWANSERSCERYTGLFAIRRVYSPVFYSLMWTHLKDARCKLPQQRISNAEFTLSSAALIETSRELWMRRGSANVHIHTLVQELWDKVDAYSSRKSGNSHELTIGLIKSVQELNKSVLTVASIMTRDICLLWLGMIYWHVSMSFKMRQELLESGWDELLHYR